MMKKAIVIILTAIMAVSCDKAFINGDLDGMWHLENVAYPDSIVKPDMVFYSFQRHMVQVSKHYDIGLPTRFLGELEYGSSSITMSNFYSFPLEKYKATPEMLMPFHLYSDSTVFTIVSLEENDMILKNGERIYTLRKW